MQNNATTPPSDFTVTGLAAVLGVHPMTIQRLLKVGAVRSYKIGRARRIPREELERIRNESLPSRGDAK